MCLSIENIMQHYEKSLRNSALECIANCYTGFDLIEKVEMIRSTLHNESCSFKDLALFKSRIKRCENSLATGTLKSEDYDVRIANIQKSIIDIVGSLKATEVVTGFEYNAMEGIIFNICDSNNEFMYKYIGKLKNYMPHGKGIAKYQNGEFFDGEFHFGTRNGKGIFYDKKRRIRNKGIWKNDSFVDDKKIRFYKDIKVGANSKRRIDIVSEPNFELTSIPNISGKGLVAFILEGNSMEPTFYEGDTVVCRELTSFDQLINSKVYVIFHEENLMLKIVQRDEGQPYAFQLVSENYIVHYPIKILANQKTKFYKIVSHIRNYKN